MTKSVRSSPGARGEQTRERILRAAGKLIGSLGYRKTTITEIAEVAGIGKATVYLYFQDKQDLFTYMVRRETMKILAQIREAVDRAHTAEDRLRAFIVTRYRSIRSLLDIYQAGPRILLEDQAVMQRAAAEYREQELALVERILRDGQAEGSLEMRDPQIAAMALTGTLLALDQPWIFGEAPINLVQSADDLVQLFLHGVIARKETA